MCRDIMRTVSITLQTVKRISKRNEMEARVKSLEDRVQNVETKLLVLAKLINVLAATSQQRRDKQ